MTFSVRFNSSTLKSAVFGASIMLGAATLFVVPESIAQGPVKTGADAPEVRPGDVGTETGITIDNYTDSLNTFTSQLTVEVPMYRVRGEIQKANYHSKRNQKHGGVRKPHELQAGLGIRWQGDWFGRIDVARIGAARAPARKVEGTAKEEVFKMYQSAGVSRLSEVTARSNTAVPTEYRFDDQTLLDHPIGHSLYDAGSFSTVDPDGTRTFYTHRLGEAWIWDEANFETGIKDAPMHAAYEDDKFKLAPEVEIDWASYLPTKTVNLDGFGLKIEYHHDSPVPKKVTECQWVVSGSNMSCTPESVVEFDLMFPAQFSPSGNYKSTQLSQICYPGPNSTSAVARDASWNCTKFEYDEIKYTTVIFKDNPTTFVLSKVTFEGDVYDLEYWDNHPDNKGQSTSNSFHMLRSVDLPRGAKIEYGYFDDHRLGSKTVHQPGLNTKQEWRYDEVPPVRQKYDQQFKWTVTAIEGPAGNGGRLTTVFYHYPAVQRPKEDGFFQDFSYGDRNPFTGKVGRVETYAGALISDHTKGEIFANGRVPLKDQRFGYARFIFGRHGIHGGLSEKGWINYTSQLAFKTETTRKGNEYRGTVTNYHRMEKTGLSEAPEINDTGYDVFGNSTFERVFDAKGLVETFHNRACEAAQCRIRFKLDGSLDYSACQQPVRVDERGCLNDHLLTFVPNGLAQATKRTFVKDSEYLKKNLVSLVATETTIGGLGEDAKVTSEQVNHYDNAGPQFPDGSVGDASKTVRGRLTATEQLDVNATDAPSRIRYFAYHDATGGEPSGLLAGDAEQIDANRSRITTYSYLPASSGMQVGKPTKTRVLAPTGGYAVVSEVDYNPWGLPVSSTDENRQTTTSVYDNKGRLLEQTLPGQSASPAQTKRYENLAHGLKITTTEFVDGKARSESVYNDSMGRRIKTTRLTDAGLVTENIKYVQHTAHVSEVSGKDPSIRTDYDAYYRPLRTTHTGADGNVSTTQIQYGEHVAAVPLNARVEIDEHLGTKITTFDAFGRKTREVHEGTPAERDKDKIEIIQDGQVVYSYDPTGPIHKPEVIYEYEPNGKIGTVIHPDKKRTTITYNGFNEPETRTTPESGVSTTTYNRDGSVNTRTTGQDDTVVIYGYDVRGRKVLEQYGTDPAAADSDTIVYTYDSPANGSPVAQENLAGRVSQISHNGGVETFSYDANGNLSAQAVTLDGLGDKVATLEHDQLGLLKSISYQEGAADELALTYHYGAGGELVQVTDSITGESLTTWEYDRNDRMVRKVLGDNVQTVDYRYDGLGRPVAINDVDANGAGNNDAFAMRYDYAPTSWFPNAGTRLDTIPTSMRWNSHGNNAGAYELTYDHLRQLDAAQYYENSSCSWGQRCSQSTAPSATNRNSLLIAGYDSVGSILGIKRYSSIGVMQQVTHNYSHTAGARRMSSVSGAMSARFSYDNAGNLTGDSRWGDDSSLRYSQRNRLMHVADAKTEQGFIYNHANQLVIEKTQIETMAPQTPQPLPPTKQQITTSRFSAVAAAIASKFSRSDDDVVVSAKYAKPTLDSTPQTRTRTLGDSSITKLRHFVFIADVKVGTYLNEDLDKLHIGKTATRKPSGPHAGTTYFIHDFIGTPRVGVHENGAVLMTADYDPFGLKIDSRSSFSDATAKTVNDAGFAGYRKYENEQNSPFFYANHRFYDPTTARFMRPDPLADIEPTLSAYAYAQNNPFAVIDPSGLYNVALGRAACCKQVYFFDQATQPIDDYVTANYTARVYVKDEKGIVHGPFRGRTYPDSKKNVAATDSVRTVWNTVDAGTHDFNNSSGHKGGTKKGLNIDDSGAGTRTTTGVDSVGTATTMQYVNVHTGYKTRCYSQGCPTLHPDDFKDFSSHFDWVNNGSTGNDSGNVHIFRGGTEAEDMERFLKATQDALDSIFGN